MYTCQRGWCLMADFCKSKSNLVEESLSHFHGLLFHVSFSFLYKSMPWDEKIRGWWWCRQEWEKKWEEMEQKPLIAIPFVCVLSDGCPPIAQISMPTPTQCQFPPLSSCSSSSFFLQLMIPYYITTLFSFSPLLLEISHLSLCILAFFSLVLSP